MKGTDVMKTDLVTGAAGFIGAEIARELLKQGRQVVTIDNLSTGAEEHIPENVIFIKGDTFDKEVLEKLEKYNIENIYHIAGQSGGITSYDDPVYDMNSNIKSTLLLLDYAAEHKCQSFIYASSMAVYGDENQCPIIEETAIIKPNTFYGIGKMASENYMRIYAEQFGIKCTALRFCNIYGPGQNMENLRQGMVSIFMSQAIKNKHIHVMGSEKRFRDFVYIDDVVRACIMATDGKEKERFNVYSIATNRKTTVEELIRLIQKVMPFEVSVEYKGSTPGDQFGVYCSYELIKKNLGWTPKIDLQNGLAKMSGWALSDKQKGK
ncbi:MAG: NAD-dependent epimerase/dehydratase family protein [Lachnospiraceae bacterium]|jgi:UDP-glucose 4-epimerase|nr:NAD-dependent epimerase/dehydratase family protein [Lachnospiraceae bacterium]